MTQFTHTLTKFTHTLTKFTHTYTEKVDLFDGAGVQSTPSMQSMLKLEGSGGMPPQENLKNSYQNTGFGDISAT